MVWIIGGILQKIHTVSSRLRCRFMLHQFAAHGENCHIEGPGEFTAANIYCGNNVFIGGGALFLSSDAKIHIGNNVMFGPRVMIATGNHRIDAIGSYMIDIKEKRPQDDQDVCIGDDVWIGMGAIILKGVTIGEGAVIGAGTIVTHSVPPYTILSGVPSVRSSERFTDEQRKRHIAALNEKNKG